MSMERGERTEASIKDVARRARVSIASVSRVMNGQPTVREETRNRVLAAVQSLNYVPHVGARSLITQKTNVVGVLLPDLHGEFFSELIRGLDGLARDRKRQLLLSSVHGQADEVAAALRALRGKVDGLVVMSPHVDAELLQRNLPRALPIVLLNSPADGIGCSTFTIDSYRGAREATKHLARRGCRRIAHLAGPPGNWDADQRLRGYKDEMKRSRPGVRLEILPGDFTQAAGYEAGQKLAASRERPDAVFAANDVLAIGCLVAFREAGVRVPEDVAVVGFDDIPLASLVSPALTTVRVHIAELGRSAMEHLLVHLADPKGTKPVTRRLVPELVVRDSSEEPTDSTRRPRRPINPR